MAEILAEISAEAKRFLDGERTDVERRIIRSLTTDVEGVSVETEQSKFISPEEMKLVRAKGALALATVQWFNDVKWLQKPREKELGWLRLSLNARYPLEYFDEEPTAGLFTENESGRYWLDQYGAISGFGDADGEATVYVPEFVAPNSRSVTRLRYPDDPTALDTYNARYRLYMDDLDAADPTIEYYRGWGRVFSHEREVTPRILGGFSLSGIGLNEVLRLSSPTSGDANNSTRVLLRYEPEQDGYIRRDITVIGDEAITEPYWDGEEDREPAGDELLATALELLKDATAERS